MRNILSLMRPVGRSRWLLLALVLTGLGHTAAQAQTRVTLATGTTTLGPGNYIVTVPANATALQAQTWGGGGAGAAGNPAQPGSSGGGGGGAAYASTSLTNPAGQTYSVTVGSGGGSSPATNSTLVNSMR